MIDTRSGAIVTSAAQPTVVNYVWGRRQDRLDPRFEARSVVVEHLLRRWTTPASSAADVSGGAGRWLCTLAPAFERFTHLDLSPDALQVAKADHPEYGHVAYEIMDLLKPPADRRFDAVFCLDTLLYGGGFVERCLDTIRRTIAPGGVAIMDVPMQFRASIAKRIKGPSHQGAPQTFKPQEFLGLLTAAGLAPVDTVYQYRELGPMAHKALLQRGLTRLLPWPSTWMVLAVRAAP